jgi:large subunit ribosomal protein L15
MKINELSPMPGSKKARMRVGRGNGSGKGTFCGRGVKGQGARTGRGKIHVTFEGGQTPLFRRMPKKRGFTSWNPTKYSVVNLSTLEKLATREKITAITPEVLAQFGIIRDAGNLVKILSEGELTQKITISAHKASEGALAKIAASGSTLALIGDK